MYNVSTVTKPHFSKSRRMASTRINLRVNRQIKAILIRAAKLQEVKLTEFMVKSSQAAAEMVLAERTRFVLSPEKWRAFNTALDSPPREIARLRKLFIKHSVFEAP